MPYHQGALQDYLGAPGPHRVEEETARAMVAQAYARARSLTGAAGHIVGLGCTAALATRRARRGEDRACMALRLDAEYWFYTLRFARGAAGRLEQENALSRLALQALVEACEGGREEVGKWPDEVEVSRRVVPVQESLEALLRGVKGVVEVGLDGSMGLQVEPRERLLFPGSFNPLHQGHVELATAAQAQSGRPLWLELSVENVDKPALSYGEVADRLQPLQGCYPVVVTRAATFRQKARLLPGSWFVIGFDTALRLLDPGYYEGGREGLARALAEWSGSGSGFLVAGRMYEGRYRTLDDLELPDTYRHMFEMIPQEAFRLDISSTEIRKQSKS